MSGIFNACPLCQGYLMHEFGMRFMPNSLWKIKIRLSSPFKDWLQKGDSFYLDFIYPGSQEISKALLLFLHLAIIVS